MIKAGSDFSGVGAFDQALKRLGIDYKTVFSCDMDKYARQTYIANYGEPDYYPENVYDREIPKEPLDIFMTSPPCQAFSLAGKRKGEDDKRGILFYNSHEFIMKNNPRYFIFENVKGLLSDAKGRTFQIWLDMLGGKSVNGNPVIFPREDAAPYHIYYKVLNAKDYGVPQNRERVFIIGIRDDKDNDFSFPKKQHLKKRLKDVLETDVDEKYYLSDLAIDRLCNNESGFSSTPKDEKDIANTVCASDYKIARGMNVLKVIKHERTEEAKIKRSKSLRTTGKDLGSFSDRQMVAVNQDFSDTVLANPNPQKEGLVMIGAFRGRNPENTSDRTTGAPMQQTLEINKNGTSNTITSVQKDNVVVYGNLRGGKWDKTHEQSGRVYDPEGIGATLHTMGGGNQHPKIYQDYQIRRLTPRECFRLMDFPEDFDISHVSDT